MNIEITEQKDTNIQNIVAVGIYLLLSLLNDTMSNKSYEQELTEDLISIIHYFSMKSYSHRRKLNKIRKELEQGG